MKKKEKECFITIACGVEECGKCRQSDGTKTKEQASKMPEGSAEVKALYQAEAQSYFFYFTSTAHTA